MSCAQIGYYLCFVPQAGDDEYSLLVNLRRCYNFQLAKSISNENLFEDLVGILRDFKNLDDEVNIYKLFIKG